jgi:N-[(2S)-2-amino-2-carboxyethyl]-L-glutamate dehydrogenase
MDDDGLLLLRGDEISALLAGREPAVVDAVAASYAAHRAGRSSLPHSTFLRFPGDEVNRIIALPAFLGDGFDIAGIKWIASFPDNVARGMERASAVLVVNSCATGAPVAILEGSVISAQRTAASAALAAKLLLQGGPDPALGLVGAGVINQAVAHFIRRTLPGTCRVTIFDLVPRRSRRLKETLEAAWPDAAVAVAESVEAVLAGCPLVSFATTAVRPHVTDLSACPPGAVLLHVSLRDLEPAALLGCDNVVDDADHVCRAQTSLHLAEQLVGTRSFIRCSLADILVGAAPAKATPAAVSVFSPFGLGVLDLAVAKLVLDQALAAGCGTRLAGFLPSPRSAAASPSEAEA